MPNSTLFVGREPELSRLNKHLAEALAGLGNICLISGNAGSGKSALVGEFTRQATAQHKKLVCAIGTANATTGAGDSYLPFREILSQLTGDVDAKLSQGDITQENATRLRKLLGLSGEAIAEIGPDLIGIFIPGAGLVARAAAFAVEKAGWIDKISKNSEKAAFQSRSSGGEITQAHIFEQYTNVLRLLSTKHPLVLVIDDLHWADTASCELLFHLARRVQGYPILILGTYRPDEVALDRHGERHPLEKVVNELKRYFGDIFIDLDLLPPKETRAFVDAFIDSETNMLGEDFRRSLFDLTDGHPLFTKELLRNMQERGDLIQDTNGGWRIGPELNWDDLPTRVEGVIEERLDRLMDDLRQALSIGSVEGKSFTADIIARVQKCDARQLIQRLSGEVQKKHRLVSSQGMQILPTTRIAIYRFQHNLFQRYLYNDLDEAERTFLHEDVGRVMEELFAGDIDRVTVQLAHHFSLAGLPEKALLYLYRAGAQAEARYANQEALRYFTRALELTHQDDLEMQYTLHSGCERIYNLLGERQKQKQELDALETLSVASGEPIKQLEFYLGFAGYYESIGEYPHALEYAQKAALDVQVAESPGGEAKAHHKWGYILWRQGNYQEALIHLEKALEVSKAAGELSVEADALSEMGVIYWRQGDCPKAEACSQQASSIYKKLDARRGQGRVFNILGNICLSQDRYEEAEAYYQGALQVDRQTGNKRGEMQNWGNLGIIAAMGGYFNQAIDRFNQILNISREINDRESEARTLGNLGSLMMEPGYYPKADEYFSQALDIFQTVGNQTGCCWIRADRGLTRLRLGLLDQALVDCNTALDLAHLIGNKHFQNSALANRAHVELKQNAFDQARIDYQNSLEINIELESLTGELEALAGLATLSIMEDDLPTAFKHVELIWEKFDPTQLLDSESRSQILLICYRVFNANGDTRSVPVLQKAYDLLMERANKYEKEEDRHSFLFNVKSNNEIVVLVGSGALAVDIP